MTHCTFKFNLLFHNAAELHPFPFFVPLSIFLSQLCLLFYIAIHILIPAGLILRSKPYSSPHLSLFSVIRFSPRTDTGLYSQPLHLYSLSTSLSLYRPFLLSLLSINAVWLSFDLCAGVIRTALPNMDREVKELYQVLIQAKDMGGQLGGLAGTTTINITLSDVNDNPPRFSKSKPLCITINPCKLKSDKPLEAPCYFVFHISDQ